MIINFDIQIQSYDHFVPFLMKLLGSRFSPGPPESSWDEEQLSTITVLCCNTSLWAGLMYLRRACKNLRLCFATSITMILHHQHKLPGYQAHIRYLAHTAY